MENSILKVIANNISLLEAVRKIIEKNFKFPVELKDRSNELLGQITRAQIMGLSAIDAAFKEIEKYKTIPNQQDKQNPAR